MKFGVSTACFYPMQTETGLLDLCRQGVANIEVFLDTFSEVKKEFVSELRKIADFYGSNIVSVHPFTCGFEPFMFFTNYERRFNDALELYRYYFEAMNILGAKILVFHGDRIGSNTSNEMYFERFARLRDLGKEYGLTVAQENVERCKSRSLDFLNDMINYLDNDVAIVFDNKQAVRSGVAYADFIERLYSNIVHVHISDNNSECDCLALGNGDLNLQLFISMLKQKKYNNCIIVELYNDLLNNNTEVVNSYHKLLMYDV